MDTTFKQLDITDIYKTLLPKPTNSPLISGAPKPFAKKGYRLRRKTNLKSLSKTQNRIKVSKYNSVMTKLS